MVFPGLPSGSEVAEFAREVTRKLTEPVNASTQKLAEAAAKNSVVLTSL